MAHSLRLIVTCDTCGFETTRTVEQTCVCVGRESVPPLPGDWSFVPGGCEHAALVTLRAPPRPTRWYCPRCTDRADV